jgi:type IV pilus assembly protein PilY1
VRVDTGEVIRTFARKYDVSNFYPQDPLLAKGRVIDTPLDSPMSGTPIVYPADVGTDATKFYIGDSDGTMWKFDVSTQDPSNWTGELFLDFYNATVDKNVSTSWGDGQPFQVTPVVALDTSGNVVLSAATGSIQQFDTTGIEYLYSVTENIQGSPAKLRANVNWWLGPATQSGSGLGFAAGERVSGPMTVFNGTLYFSTYAAAATGTQVCTGGIARLWGRDYVLPDSSSDLSEGGLRELQPPTGVPQTPPPYYVQPSDYDSTLLGKVIPGVSIMGTPACASAGSSASDQYVAGATHSAPTNFAAGGFSLYTQIGAKGSNGQTTKTFQMNVPTPIAPTAIDSWAAVLE